MKKIFFIVFIMLTTTSFGQLTKDCDCKPLTVAFGADISNSEGTFLSGVKIGVWSKEGFTAFAGGGSWISTIESNKKDSSIVRDVIYLELGYSLKINDVIYLHGFTGINKITKYAGATLLFKFEGSVLLGLSYKYKQGAAISAYFGL